MRIPRPVDEKYPISSPYGSRIDPVTKKQTEFHRGIDFAVPIGTEVRACFDGPIARIGWENENNHEQGFGQRIWQTFLIGNVEYGIVYGHLSQIDVKEKYYIKAGEVIGLSGNSGRSTGPHLHIGVREWNSGNYQEIEV